MERPAQTSPTQVSSRVHGLPSAHAAPSLGACTHPAEGLQESSEHGLSTTQSIALPARQVPLWQTSGPLQALPSSQAEPFGMFANVQVPVAWMQASLVHGLPSSQMVPALARQAPM